MVKRSPDGRTPAEQLEGIRGRAQELSTRAATVFATELLPALEKERIRIVRSFEALEPADRALPPAGVRRAHLPGADPALGGPRASVPVHLEPVAQPRGDGARPDDRRAQVRAGEGAAAAPAVRPAPRRRAVRAARDRDRRAPRPAVPGHGARGASRVPPDARRRSRGRGGRGRGSARGDPERAAPSPARREPGPARGRRDDEPRGPRAPSPRARPGGAGGRRDARAARPERHVVAGRARPPRAEARALGPGHAAAPGERRRSTRSVPGAPGGRRPRPSPVRLLLLLGGGLRRAGRPRSGRPRHQADDVPHLDAGEPDHPRADPRRGARQAGRGAGRAQGPVRRGGEHHLRARARAGRRARRLRGRRAEDAREDLARRATRGRRASAGTPTSAPATTTRSPPGCTRTSAS